MSEHGFLRVVAALVVFLLVWNPTTASAFLAPPPPPSTAPLHRAATSEDAPKVPGLTVRSGRVEISKKISNNRRKRWWRRNKNEEEKQIQPLVFPYDSHLLELPMPHPSSSSNTTGIVLIHPIGVGIAKWFYDRLLKSLCEHNNNNRSNLLVVAPDLLGSGTACNPTEIDRLPLLTVADWTRQVCALMKDLEQEYPRVENWCLVANGGCAPIALEVARQSVQQDDKDKDEDNALPSFQKPVTNVVLSSVPRLPFFLPDDETLQQRQEKLEKSYQTLCGATGRLFWWYALRKDGKFVQKFSEKNLVADAANLGHHWTPNCVATARLHDGQSRYSTFAFLAGSLQVEGCQEALETLSKDASSDDGVKIDVIRGRDNRRNRAKSWFWQKRKRKAQKEDQPKETLAQVLERNGNGGRVLECGGRISLAHEDAPGYAEALLEFLG